MSSPRPGLVDIAREFLHAYRLTRDVAAHYRSGTLDFDAVKELVGDDPSSVLFRLKERCHALFRPVDPAAGVATPRAALFDLAVGSLFHETMKFRENFYQRKVYGPKVQALRDEMKDEADELFREFEKILSASSVRLDEALQETEALLAQTREQFRLLLAANRDDGFTTRFLIENEAAVAAVFEDGLEPLLAELHGDAASGYALAAHSYLASGYFDEGQRALQRAIALDPAREREWTRVSAYAEGMSAYLGARYELALERLGEWVAAGPSAREAAYVDLALDAVSRVGALVGSDQGAVAAAAEALTKRLSELASGRERPRA